MKIPTIYLTEKQDVFGTRLRRLVQESFPVLKLVTRKDGQARRYELWHEDTLIVEIDTLPIGSELEIQAARLRLDDAGFCDAFYSMVERKYHIKMPLVWVSLKATHPMLESLADEQFDTPDEENLRLHLINSARQGLSLIEGAEPTPTENGTGEVERLGEIELASLRRQLADKKSNLLLIKERIAQFVMSTEVDLQLVKEKQQLLKDIEKLEQHVEELERPEQRAEGDTSEATGEAPSTFRSVPPERPPASERFTTHIGSVTGPVHTGQGDIIYSASPQEFRPSSESFAPLAREVEQIQKVVGHNLRLKLDDTPQLVKKMPVAAFKAASGEEWRPHIGKELSQAVVLAATLFSRYRRSLGRSFPRRWRD